MSARRRQFVVASGASLVLLAGVPRLARAETAIEQLRAFLKDTGSARGEFTQRVTSRSQSAGQVSSGSFVFQRPGRFRWVYQKPYEQVIVADGERMFLYDKDLNQVTVRAGGSDPGQPGLDPVWRRPVRQGLHAARWRQPRRSRVGKRHAACR
jgi:outer membrane lipoprotein carrier protein